MRTKTCCQSSQRKHLHLAAQRNIYEHIIPYVRSRCAFASRFFIIIFFNYEYAFCYCLRIVLFCLFSSLFPYVFLSHQHWLYFTINQRFAAQQTTTSTRSSFPFFLCSCEKYSPTQQHFNSNFLTWTFLTCVVE